MDIKIFFGIAGTLVAFLQYGLYIRTILLGKTKPHVFSWFVWGVPCGVVFLAQLVKGGGAGAWVTGATALLCTFIFLLSLHYGEKRITKLDVASFVLALIAIALWLITKDPLWSVILISLADVLGMIPTLRKSYDNPYEEDLLSYVVANMKWTLSFLALETISFTTALYPVAMFLSIAILIVFLMWRRAKLKQA